MFVRFFIDRPIFATVLSIIITLAGSVALSTLPVAQYPEITPPTVEVSAVYPGANALTVDDTVAAPIEQQVNGVEDMLYMSSRATNDGTYTLTVTFKPETDLNIAQVLVQNRVNLAQPVLPDIVKRRGVVVKKKSPTQLMIINLYSPDGSRDNLYLSNYATIRLRDELARVTGVGDITYLGQRDYSMRLWLDPDKMSSRNISATDITNAISQQNIQVAAGQVGQPPAPDGQVFQYTINTLGRLVTKEQFASMILKTDDQGRIVRMSDVTTRVELGALGYDQVCTLDGKPSVALSIYQLPGSNAIQTANDVKKKMAELRKKFETGLEYSIVYDTTPFITESVDEVFRTLRDAVILVAIVMLVFLQSWRAAIIPLCAVPVAIVGTFAAMAGLGYSINNLTLFGLVLAVGIVVDDAIVVIEAVQHHIEEGMSPREATIQAMDEVSGPVIAVGLVLAAVFIPCIFINGIIGQFFRQFAVTIAISTLLSAFNSLTLSPALCALLLKRTEEEKSEPLPRLSYLIVGGVLAWLFAYPEAQQWLADHPERVPLQLRPYMSWLLPSLILISAAILSWAISKPLNYILAAFFSLFNKVFNLVTGVYIRIVGLVLRLSIIVLIGYGGMIYLTYKTLNESPAGFIPDQDKGYLMINVQLPDSASLKRTDDLMKEIDDVARQMAGIDHTVAISGQSVLLGANAPNFGTLYVLLKPFSERKDSSLGADAIMATLKEVLNDKISGAIVNVFGAPPVDGLGATGGFSMVIEDPINLGPAALQNAIKDVVATVESAQDQVQNAFSGYRADTPWLRLDIDRIAAKTRNVSVAEIVNALQVFFGSLYVNDFNQFDRTWQVNVQADGKFRQRPEDFKRLNVRSDSGQKVPLSAVLSIKETVGPVMIQRYNLYPCAILTITPVPGVSSGSVIDVVEKKANEKLPPSMKAEWTELAFLQLQTANTAVKAFILAVVLAFLVLAAQYESWSLPFAVILVVPMCLLFAAAGINFNGMDINIFTQIGFVVLVGLACKNAILIVEFAKARKEAGATNRQATLEACKLRLRPIIMTSFAFILGVVPLLVAEGAGAEMRRSLGTAVFYGMTGVTLLGIFLTPVFFFVIQFGKDKLWKKALQPEVLTSSPDHKPTGKSAHHSHQDHVPGPPSSPTNNGIPPKEGH